MSEGKVHQDIWAKVNEALPAGSELVDIVSVNATTGQIRYRELGGLHKMTSIAKVNPTEAVGRNVFQIDAEQGEFIGKVIERFCANYRLPMAPGTDYEVNDDLVDFGDIGSHTVVINIPESSPLLTGSITLVLRDVNRPKIDSSYLSINADVTRDMLLLMTDGFVTKGPFTEKGFLSEEAVQVILEYAGGRGGFRLVNEEVLKTSPLRFTGNDGVSQYVAIDTDYGNFSIRFDQPES